MKLLLVLVSALVLVAQGKAAPSKDEERVNVVQSDVVAGYAFVDAGQEAGGEGLQYAFAEEAPAVYEPQVVGAEPEQRAFAVGNPAAERNIYGAPETIYIPIISRACTNSSCLYICNLLGFPKGVCVSTDTCQCYS